ncbi:pyridoxamine 5'-phosphate oxidase family protein [Pantoea sp. S18]|uniref:pyridoxamine 5'-phosphate oxidase family protein n=1 Tax=Pantoea sp. S18 TaxID=3019892 RepID=UPI002B1F3813|nr:pyridoxamine 5'-phosphate oxidase family protein [Pantoea sp. S18]MEA5100963.1 pyridoxamine 5'-phosphate oxidase family protein [Pantoea sp. S18]
MSLCEIDTACWKELETGAREPDSGFHFLTLASVDLQGKPQARTLVLRAVDREKRTLEFHTDMRSPKWQALAVNPEVTVLGYCVKTQLRLQGTVERHAAHSAIAEAAWQRLSRRTQQTYAGAAPGSDIDNQSNDVSNAGDNFGVLIIQITQLDWCLLARENNQRALLSYRSDGALTNSKWVNP